MRIGKKTVSAINIGRRSIASVRQGLVVLWEAISTLFFTKDNQVIITRDGKIFDTKK